MKHIYVFLLLLTAVCGALPLVAQPGATSMDAFLEDFNQRRKSMLDASLLGDLQAVNIGPSIFSCRVTDLEANPDNPAQVYVAYASGGLWHTENNGTSFKSLFDEQATMTIGDIAVDWTRRIVWVGAGEVNSSRSSYAGSGLYRSDDGGKTWQHRGLPESHHIGRIVLHPTNPDILWVAAMGHLYTPNPERGVYHTTDGGKTWQRTLYVDNNTGAIDLVIDPLNPEILYAATWERDRKAWNFNGAGPGSGIWKSADGGRTWTRLNTPASGFPHGDKTGRIGLAAGAFQGRTVLYACIDNQNPKPPKAEEDKEIITKKQLRAIEREAFLKLEDKQLDKFLKDNEFPEKYNASSVKEMVRSGKISPQTLVEYLEDANAGLFEVDYIGAEVYRSDDGGATWKRTHEEPLDGINFTYGYYFSNIRCRADNPEQVYLLGFYIVKSADGGKTWKNINGDNVHVDHHALWLNPRQPGHLINGNDGGMNVSWDDGASWLKCNNPPVGQFYAVAVDQADPYRVYGGAQDNGVWVGPSQYRASTAWHQTGRYPYRELLGGDGMQVAVDPRDNNTVYTGYQFGNYFRIDQRGGKETSITPKHDLGERPPRFNWQTPIHLSAHQSDILYLGAHKLYRSFNRGDTWEAISGDLTGGGKPGNVPYGTLTSIHESPLRLGLLYTGSDDGLAYVSRDGGDTWTRISDGLPQNLWVSRIQASAHERARVYISLNGYRWDDFTPYLYRSDDYGNTWTRIGQDLPLGPINVVREDPVNPDLLYIGADHGCYISLDGGQSFQALGNGFPAVAVHDLAVQAKAGDLIIGTHGRSMFKMNIKSLQQLTAEKREQELVVFPLKKTRYSSRWGKKQTWAEAKDPELPVQFYCLSAGALRWTIKTDKGLELNTGTINARKGVNEWTYTLDVQEDRLKKYLAIRQETDKKAKVEKSDAGKYYLLPGVYQLILEKNGITVQTTFEIEASK